MPEIQAKTNRSYLIDLFSRIDATESSWALEKLSNDDSETPSVEDLKTIADCLCKINDHGSGDEVWYKESESLEGVLCKILYPSPKESK